MVMADDSPVPTSADMAKSTGRLHREQAFNVQDDRCIRQRLSESGGYFLTVRGASHMDFCDSPLYSPIKRITHAGPIRAERAVEIINAYVLAFFRVNLKGEDEPLLNGPSSPFPEVEFERFPGEKLPKEPS